MFAERLRLGNSDQFPCDGYPADAAWTGLARKPKLIRESHRTECGGLTCTWHRFGPNGSGIPAYHVRSDRVSRQN